MGANNKSTGCIVYENVFIGNFIFELGIKLGKESLKDNKTVKGGMNLFQQTPMDKICGDCIGNLNGKFFMLEFKREENKSDKEKKKVDKLKRKEEEIKLISRNCHFYMMFGDKMGENLLDEARYGSYIDWGSYAGSVRAFIDKIHEFGVDVKSFKVYLSKLKEIYNSEGGTALIICRDDEKWGVTPINDIGRFINNSKQRENVR